MRHLLLTLMLVSAGAIAVPVHAQVIPSPRAGQQLYVRNSAGKIVERLQPNGDQYDVIDTRQSTRTGYAVLIGRRMVIYDLNNNIVATVRAELLPPDANLSAITIVRDTHGHSIGVLEHY
jgi:hypothetical protein